MGLFCNADSKKKEEEKKAESLCARVGVCFVAHQFHFQLAHSEHFNFKVLIKSKGIVFFP